MKLVTRFRGLNIHRGAGDGGWVVGTQDRLKKRGKADLKKRISCQTGTERTKTSKKNHS